MPTPRCPECKSSMQEGFVSDRGNSDKLRPGAWLEGAPEYMLFGFLRTRGKKKFRIVAFRCGRCGLLQMYAVEPSK